MPGTSNPSEIQLSLGGVGYRIYHHLASPKRFITAVGDDPFGGWIAAQLAAEASAEASAEAVAEAHPAAGAETVIQRIAGCSSALYIAFMETGKLLVGASDMRAVENGLTLSVVAEVLDQAGSSDILVLDANLCPALVAQLLQRYAGTPARRGRRSAGTPRRGGTPASCHPPTGTRRVEGDRRGRRSAGRMRTVFESVSVEKILRHAGALSDLFLLAANEAEFNALISEPSAIVGFMAERRIENILVTRGMQGVCLYGGAPHEREFPLRHRIEIGNTTGAGDTLLAFLLQSVAEEIPLNTAIPLAMRSVAEALEAGRL